MKPRFPWRFELGLNSELHALLWVDSTRAMSFFPSISNSQIQTHNSKSRFQAAVLVGAPSYPYAIAWSDENLIAVASGHLVTILVLHSLSTLIHFNSHNSAQETRTLFSNASQFSLAT